MMIMKKFHLQISPKTKQFECEYCGTFFDTKGHLKEHTNIHTRVKEHKCPHCEHTSTKKNNITRHAARKHSNPNS